MRCFFKDCQHEAKWKFEILLWAKGHYKKHTPMIAAPDVVICNDHRKTFEVKDWFDDSTKDKLNEFIMDMQKAPVDWTKFTVKWISITDKKGPNDELH